MHKLSSSILTLSFVVAAPLAAGTIMKIDRRELPSETVEQMTITVDGTLVAISGASDSRMIFRGDEQKMLVIDDTNKSYMVLDQAMATGVAKQMDAATKQIDDAIAKLPADQQAMARRMMEQQQRQMPQAPVQGRGPAVGAASITPGRNVTRTAETATKEGYPCVKYEVFEEGEKIRELWVTDWSNIEGRAELEAAMRSMKDFTSRLTAAFGKMGGSGSSTGAGSIATWWEGIAGMPVVTTDFKAGAAVEESVIKSIDAGSVEGSTFEVPADYKQKTIGG